MVRIALDEVILAADDLKLGLLQFYLNPLGRDLMVAGLQLILRCLRFAVNHDEYSAVNQRLGQMAQNGWRVAEFMIGIGN